MTHDRLVLVPGMRAVSGTMIATVLFVALVSLGAAAARGADLGPADVLLPAGVAAALCAAEAAWFLLRRPRSVTMDAEGIGVLERDGSRRTFAWRELAERDRRVFAGGWILRRADRSEFVLSAAGIPREGAEEANRRIWDVLLHGPPLDRTPGTVPPGREEAVPEESPAGIALGLAGASTGALLGAVGWGLLTGLTRFEIGYAAMGVGALVGGGAKFLGGRGRSIAAASAALALAAILVGKGLAGRLILEADIREGLTPGIHESISRAAAEFAKGVPPERHAAFMAAHDIVEAEDAGAVTPEELEGFRRNTIPFLLGWNASPPTFEEWRADRFEGIRADVLSRVGFLDLVLGSLGALDILFGFLGVSAAYRVALGKQAPPPRVPARRSTGREAPLKPGSRVKAPPVFPPKRRGEEAAPGTAPPSGVPAPADPPPPPPPA